MLYCYINTLLCRGRRKLFPPTDCRSIPHIYSLTSSWLCARSTLMVFTCCKCSRMLKLETFTVFIYFEGRFSIDSIIHSVSYYGLFICTPTIHNTLIFMRKYLLMLQCENQIDSFHQTLACVFFFSSDVRWLERTWFCITNRERGEQKAQEKMLECSNDLCSACQWTSHVRFVTKIK